MLKIKDNVDLEELKKFGFGFDVSLDDGKLYWWNCDIFIGDNKIICQDDGVNTFKDTEHSFSDNEIDILYDLIKSDLVEKVED